MWYRNIEPKLRAAGCGSLCSASGRNLKSLQVLRPSLVSSPTDPPEHHVRTPTLQENWNEERKMWYRNIEPKLRAAGCGSLCSASGRNLKSLQVLRPSLVSSPTDPPEHHVRTPTLQENWNEERKMWYRNIEPKLRGEMVETGSIFPCAAFKVHREKRLPRSSRMWIPVFRKWQESQVSPSTPPVFGFQPHRSSRASRKKSTSYFWKGHLVAVFHWQRNKNVNIEIILCTDE
ncbi:uncharacterized protein [Manis javanica]